jgi:hypothetical protein
MRLVELVVVKVGTTSIYIGVTDEPLVLGQTVSIGIIAVVSGEERDEKGTTNRAQRSHTAHQQRKYVEQASASSGNQCVLGHRSVPRFELFAPDDSTNGGRAMFGVLARLASASIPVFEQEKQHATKA